MLSSAVKKIKVAAAFAVPDHRADCGPWKLPMMLCSQRGSDSPANSSWFLKAPEELQRQFIGQEHGGAHGKPSDGVDRSSTEENLHNRKKKVLKNNDLIK